MSKTLSNHGHFQRLTARPHIAALLFLLSACSGSPVSLGSGLDDEQSALTDSRRGDTAEDCATNPLGPGCPTAEDCATNPLGPGCPTADPTAIDCGAIFNECLIEAFAAGEEPARCEAIRWACGRSMYASEPGVDD